MVLQALNHYYDLLTSEPDMGVSPANFSSANVSFAINLSTSGELLDLFPLYDLEQRGKKTVEVPRKIIVPEQIKRSGKTPPPNFLCDNAGYVFGVTAKGEDDPEYALSRFKAFRLFHLEMLKDAKGIPGKAVVAFLNTFSPENARNHPAIAAHLQKLLEGGNLIFKLDGISGFVHEDDEIKHIWEVYKAGNSGELHQCLVTGEIAPVARLHASLKGIKDANPTGATMVGFNARAYESYNKKQGENSPVSEKAAFGYTTALNYLLASKNKFYIGDTTVVYWADSVDLVYPIVFADLFGLTQETPADKKKEAQAVERKVSKKAERLLADLSRKIESAQAIDVNALLGEMDGNTRFYVLGLGPNAARISIRFFYQEPFIKMVEKIIVHHEDMRIEKEFEDQPVRISPWQIISETLSKKSSDKIGSPLLPGALISSILNNQPYPMALYYAIINRVRADMDDKKAKISKINYRRAAIIKGFLIRKYRFHDVNPYKEELSMSLNETSTNPAYLLGRLFAVLEKAQQEAIGDVNASIKDRYFTSACASPATVFPMLLRLSQHHISKAEYGKSIDHRIENIMNLLEQKENPIPAHLSLDEQGVFILGYYHQRADFYKGKKDITASLAGPNEN